MLHYAIQVISTEVTIGELPKNPSAVDAQIQTISATSDAINKGKNPQNIKLTFSFNYQAKSSFKFSKKTQYSFKAKVSFGIPFTNQKGELEYGVSQEYAEEEVREQTLTVGSTVELQQQIQGGTAQSVKATTNLQNLVVKVPVTIRYKLTCNAQDKIEENTMEVTASGVANAISSSFKIEYGTPYPVELDPVYPPANATCQSNPNCANIGIKTGNCCPNEQGIYLDCCSFCSIRPSCSGFAQTKTTMCCPTITDVQQACCSGAVAQNSPPPPPPSPPPPPPSPPPPPPARCVKGDADCYCLKFGLGVWADTESNCKNYYECFSAKSVYKSCGTLEKFSQEKEKCVLGSVKCGARLIGEDY